MKLNNYEVIGMGIAVVVMATALWLTEFDKNIEVARTAGEEAVENKIVEVADSANQTAALTNAILEASGGDATLDHVVVDDVVVGTGPEVTKGDTVTVHYIGTLPNGQEFDSSRKRGTPFTFTVGEGRVIKGWEQGILGMQVGGQRILVIPSEFGYGDSGYGPIPGGATLVFAIELLSIE